MTRHFVALATAGGLAIASPALAQTQNLALTWLGRDAVFVDTLSISTEASRRTFHLLRIVEEGNAVGTELFLGGWQTAVIDCEARTYRALTFTSLRESGVVGPEQTLRGDAYPIAGDSAEAGMELAVCKNAPPYKDRAGALADAARIGRARMAENAKPH